MVVLVVGFVGPSVLLLMVGFVGPSVLLALRVAGSLAVAAATSRHGSLRGLLQ